MFTHETTCIIVSINIWKIKNPAYQLSRGWNNVSVYTLLDHRRNVRYFHYFMKTDTCPKSLII